MVNQSSLYARCVAAWAIRRTKAKGRERRLDVPHLGEEPAAPPHDRFEPTSADTALRPNICSSAPGQKRDKTNPILPGVCVRRSSTIFGK